MSLLMLMLVLFLTAYTRRIISTSSSGTEFDHDLISSKYFVDKTGLLREFFQGDRDRDSDHPNNYVACPPGFGKTTNLKMIRKFSEIEFDEKGDAKHWKDTRASELFEKLKISRCGDKCESIVSEHLARHPVLFFDLSFDLVREMTRDKILSIFNARLVDSFKKYVPGLMTYLKTTANSTRSSTSSSRTFETLLHKANENKNELTMRPEDMAQFLQDLCVALYNNYNQTPVIILVDEFDYVMNQGMSSLATLNFIYESLRKIFCRVFESLGGGGGSGSGQNQTAIYAMMTGSTTLAFRHYRFVEFSRVHHFSEYSRFTPFFGILDDELVSLYDKYDCDRFERHYVSQYYAGYTTVDGNGVGDGDGDPNVRVCRYNSYSISEYLKRRSATHAAVDASPLQFPTIQYGGPFRQTFIPSFLKDAQYLDKVAKLLKNCPIQGLFKHKYDHKAVKSFDSFVRHDFGNAELPFRNILYTFTIEQGFFAPVDDSDGDGVGVGENTYAIPNYDIRGRFVTYLLYNYEQRLRIDLQHIGHCIHEILTSPRDQPSNLIADLTRALNSAFEKFRPFKESGGMSSLHFTHQLLIDVAALTYEGLHLVNDYPYPSTMPYNANQTKFKANKRRACMCVSVITFADTAAVIKITYNQPLQTALLAATSYSYKDENINRVRYIAIDIPYRNFTRICMATLNATASHLNDTTKR